MDVVSNASNIEKRLHSGGWKIGGKTDSLFLALFLPPMQDLENTIFGSYCDLSGV